MKLTTPSTVDLKNDWNYTSAPPCILMAYTGENLHVDPSTSFVVYSGRHGFIAWRRKKV